jgi:hypothetical protein
MALATDNRSTAMTRKEWFRTLSVLVPLAATVSTASRSTPAAEGGPGAAALHSWVDVDGDARLELAVLSRSGELKLFELAAGGHLVDATEAAGLAGIDRGGALLFQDHDGDGRVDLFVGAREGRSLLFRNEGGRFLDVTEASGLALEGEVLAARWLDQDGDGRLDLHAVTRGGSRLFRGREGGFDPLPLPRVAESPGRPTAPEGVLAVDSLQPWIVSPACAPALRDSARPGACLGASSTPELGKLYPLGRKLFVSPIGNVGLGTETPVTKLHLATAGAHCIARLESAGPTHGESGLRFRTGRGAGDLAGWDVFMDDSTLDELGDPDRLGFFHAAAGVVLVLDIDGSTGKVGIGKRDPSAELDVLGDVCVSGGGMYLTCSDRRLKRDVADLADPLAKVLALRGVEFRWRAEELPERRLDGDQQIGFIAQEVAEVVPQVVSQGSDGYYSLDYGKLTPLLVEALQAQEERIVALESAGAALRKRVEELESLAAELAAVKAALEGLAGLARPR